MKQILAIALLCALCSTSVWAQSKQPARPQNNVAPSQQNAQPSQPDLRGTENVPLAVKVIPSESAEEKTSREKAEHQERAEKAELDRRLVFDTQRLADDTGRLARYTWWLGFFTLGLLLIAGGQALLFSMQLRFMREGMADTANAAEAARQSAETALAEFRMTHRPELRVHSVRLWDFEPSEAPDRQPLRAEFAIVNIGSGQAQVTGSAATLGYFYPIDRPYLPRLMRNDVIPHRFFAVGATDSFAVASDHLGGLNHTGGAHELGKVLYFCGWIVYQDADANARTTYFYRQWNPATERFTLTDDPEGDITH